MGTWMTVASLLGLGGRQSRNDHLRRLLSGDQAGTSSKTESVDTRRMFDPSASITKIFGPPSPVPRVTECGQETVKRFGYSIVLHYIWLHYIADTDQARGPQHHGIENAPK